jgi:hypothetical protein
MAKDIVVGRTVKGGGCVVRKGDERNGQENSTNSVLNGFFLGLGTAALAYVLRGTLRSQLVNGVRGLIVGGERALEAAYNSKEYVEDIVAEANYERMRTAGTEENMKELTELNSPNRPE